MNKNNIKNEFLSNRNLKIISQKIIFNSLLLNNKNFNSVFSQVYKFSKSWIESLEFENLIKQEQFFYKLNKTFYDFLDYLNSIFIRKIEFKIINFYEENIKITENKNTVDYYRSKDVQKNDSNLYKSIYINLQKYSIPLYMKSVSKRYYETNTTNAWRSNGENKNKVYKRFNTSNLLIKK